MPKFLAIDFSGEVRSNLFGACSTSENRTALLTSASSVARTVLPVIMSAAFVASHDLHPAGPCDRQADVESTLHHDRIDRTMKHPKHLYRNSEPNSKLHRRAFGATAFAGVVAGFVSKSSIAADSAKPRRILAADKNVVAIVDDSGKVLWQFENGAEAHDLHLLANGNVLLPGSRTKVVEVTPDKKVVWSYDAKPRDGYDGRVEVHAFQPLQDGRVMVAESGNRRIVEVDREGRIAFEMPLTVDNPHPHRDTRMVRRLHHGGYLVCHEADATVREYDRSGKVLWSYALDLGGRPRSDGHGPEGHGVEVYGAVRLANGNTLIGGGNNNRVLEVNPAGKVVWSIDQKELPGITLAWVTTVTRLPDGNTIVGNCHAGKGQPQLFEVTPDKKVMWIFENFETFGNGLAASQVLDLPDGTIR